MSEFSNFHQQPTSTDHLSVMDHIFLFLLCFFSFLLFFFLIFFSSFPSTAFLKIQQLLLEPRHFPIMATQAAILPSTTTNITLGSVPKYPSEIPSFNVWIQRVWRELVRQGLQDLIDTSIPRPKLADDSQTFLKWNVHSIRVSSWLRTIVDTEVETKIWSTYADDMVRDIHLLDFQVRCPPSPALSSSSSSGFTVTPDFGPHPDTDTDTEPEPGADFYSNAPAIWQNQDGKIRNMPPWNKDPSVYAYRWRTLPNQTSPNGNCTYCDEGGHGTARCCYLCPELRPVMWEPSESLWYLGWKQNLTPDFSRWHENGFASDTASWTTGGCTGSGMKTPGSSASLSIPSGAPQVHVRYSEHLTDVFINPQP